MFGIHLDESTHHNKVRLEFWMVFFDSKKERREKYSTTKGLKVDFDLQLLHQSGVTSFDDLKLVDSEKVFEKFLEVLKDFNLDVLNLRYIMTDNCNTMRGSKKGLGKKFNEVVEMQLRLMVNKFFLCIIDQDIREEN